jgi:hypothetical protein
VNVRVLELIDSATGSRIELEGNRLPVTHSKGRDRHAAGLTALGPGPPGLARLHPPREP